MSRLVITGDSPKESRFSGLRTLRRAVARIEIDELGGREPSLSVTPAGEGAAHLALAFDLEQAAAQDDWRLTVTPSFTPTFHWAPHLTPADGYVIDQHVFRSPALIVQDATTTLALVPELELVPEARDAERDARAYLDQNAIDNQLVFGLSKSRVAEHVLFQRSPGAQHQGRVRVGLWLLASTAAADLENPWRRVLEFFWQRYGSPAFARGEPLGGDLTPYVRHAYAWAFERWPSVWQEFELDGRRVGAPVFIVNVTQSPNYPGPVNEREFRSIWNQCWFSSLRSAAGLYRFARREGDARLADRALLSKELALAFPQHGGLFHALVGTEMHDLEIDGRKLNRSRGWESHFFGNSNRNPRTWDARRSPWHLPDMSQTALEMLRWFSELEADPRLLAYVRGYASRLLSLQQPDGHVPSWLELGAEAPLPELEKSPQTALSALLMLRLFEIVGDERLRRAGLRAAEAVEPLARSGQWEDFETYFSCCRWGTPALIGKKVERNGTFKQSTLCMAWSAEAFAKAYELSGDSHFLALGRRCLDELLMYQAVWQPPYIYVPALGGFGVMNCDGEWNDARQSSFAELIADYGQRFDSAEYRERSMAALRASFSMMFCPENARAYEQWRLAWPFFGREDHGFMMENYAHGGRTSPAGEGIGEFTIYDWGSGCAAAAWNRLHDRHGHELPW